MRWQADGKNYESSKQIFLPFRLSHKMFYQRSPEAGFRIQMYAFLPPMKIYEALLAECFPNVYASLLGTLLTIAVFPVTKFYLYNTDKYVLEGEKMLILELCFQNKVMCNCIVMYMYYVHGYVLGLSNLYPHSL